MATQVASGEAEATEVARIEDLATKVDTKVATVGRRMVDTEEEAAVAAKEEGDITISMAQVAMVSHFVFFVSRAHMLPPMIKTIL